MRSGDQQRWSPLCGPEAAEVLDAFDREHELASGTAVAEAAAEQTLKSDPYAVASISSRLNFLVRP